MSSTSPCYTHFSMVPFIMVELPYPTADLDRSGYSGAIYDMLHKNALARPDRACLVKNKIYMRHTSGSTVICPVRLMTLKKAGRQPGHLRIAGWTRCPISLPTTWYRTGIANRGVVILAHCLVELSYAFVGTDAACHVQLHRYTTDRGFQVSGAK